MKLILNREQILALGKHIADALHLRHQSDNLLLGLPSNEFSAHHLEQALSNINVSAQQQTTPKHYAYPALALDKEGYFWFFENDGKSTFSSLDEAKPKQLSDIDKELIWYLSHDNVTDERSEKLHTRIPSWLKPAWDQVKPFYNSLLLASLTVNLLALVVPLFTMNVYDRVVPNAALDTLWVLATGATIAIVFDWLLKQARGHLTDAAGRQIDLRISSMLYAKVLGMRLEQRPASAGAYAKQVQDFDSVREFITSATLVSVIDLPFTLLFLALIFWLGGLIVLIPVVVLTLVVITSAVLQARLSESVEQASKLSTQRQAYLIENLNQLVELKQMNGQAGAQQKLEQTLAQMVDWQNKSRHSATTLTHTVASLSQFTSIALIVFGVYLISNGDISMGALIAIVMLSGRASGSISALAGLVLKYKQTQTAIESVKNIMALEQEQKSGENTINAPVNGNITARHLSFQYHEQELEAVHSINFEIKQGEKIGLYGRAGSGKSTLLAIIAGQYRATSGQLLIDDIDIRHWSLSALRKQSGWVAQSPSLFYGTVLENITLGAQNITPTNLTNALVKSGVSRFIDRLESGLETQVGEFGRFLSGGQRQAVCIARALLKDDNALLILDEPSSAMDAGHEKLLIKTLQDRTETVVISSHRKDMLTICDRIFVLDHGRLKSIETPSSLFSNKVHGGVKLVSKKVTRVNTETGSSSTNG
ncbi:MULTISPECIES: ATP-binding cassette domain-containing protein [unclassified Pseudoalteromonas]|uniref:ATP-binding cassette domain-containing protein n=1 Tax=unclassified Pseudoalteromonas TaxID=194690 RepID=UPI001603E2FE|nr:MULTISPECIES: ATP-binding cassette domain-containing protein [unclassified Pseudoalteromonas]MBB1345164.1 ATP-binding cassette domain-containing protein [Pseudoalteromonas sp. SG45-2]MBB1351726.1 ATP-binding cassette domain-containing protein [Pseudoalteromonas sp. SG45-3]MBB1359694.1 ATP-binding cassette domain-containing protein [Pseudoalteromonas sp. SG45-6]